MHRAPGAALGSVWPVLPTDSAPNSPHETGEALATNLPGSAAPSLSWCSDLPRSFVPALMEQPLLQGQQVDFGVRFLQGTNVGLETRITKPPKHLVKLLAQNQADQWQRKLLKFDTFSQDAA